MPLTFVPTFTPSTFTYRTSPPCHRNRCPSPSRRALSTSPRPLSMCAEPPPAKASQPQPANAQSSAQSSAQSPAAPIEPPPQTQLGGGGEGGTARPGGGGDGSGNGDGNGGERRAVMYTDRMRQVQKAAQERLQSMGRLSGSAYGQVTSVSGALLKNVPAPVLVALISLFSTVQGARYKSRLDKAASERAKVAAAQKRRDEIEEELRREYVEVAAPILKSAAKLAERLLVLVESEWEGVGGVEEVEQTSPLYSAYLLGRYLGSVELMKRQSALLDYGFPAGDRILANILGRIQGVLSAGDDVLGRMQETERLFQPRGGEGVLGGGGLRIAPRTQTVLGELMFRKTWGKYEFVERVGEREMGQGPKAVISFLEFERIMGVDATMSKWYEGVVNEFGNLEKTVRRVPREKRRCDEVGARVYFLQSALLDLVEFFDPEPAQAVPMFRRRRLQLGKLRHAEEQRSPLSLHKLYGELANVRDSRVVGENVRERLRLPGGGVEVHVKGSSVGDGGDDSIVPTRNGDCPYSQRVLIVLEEMGIPYRSVFISPKAKPAWFYLLQPENKTPVVYHDGTLVENAKHIVSYLLSNFSGTGKQLGSADKLRLAVGTDMYIRFHDRFKMWVSGNETAKMALERELKSLNTVIARAQKENEGLPFLGGDRFAREDTAIAPMLNNVQVAGRALKGWEIPDDCQALKKYLNAARQVSSFAKTVGDDETIVAGYDQLRVNGGEKAWRLADMLE